MNNNQTVYTKPKVSVSGLRRAKVILIEDIAKMRGTILSQVEFNELYDLDLDLLHAEVIRAQDQRYFNCERLKAKLY